jgi:spermidine synthase
LPTSYYHPGGPLGYIMLGVAPPKPGRRVGVVGLGAGTTAAYAGPGESWTFYEIDPLVERIARDTTLFTFLVDARSPPRIVMGDARISLAHDSTARYDVMILDAFSSDAPPIHLLTREAVRLYFQRLAPGGLLAIHLSNRYIDFPPVVAALAADADLVGRVWGQEPPLAQIYRGAFGSVWAVLARREDDLGRIARDPRWEPLVAVPDALWTDDYSNIYRRIR